MFQTEIINDFRIRPLNIKNDNENWNGKDVFGGRKYWNLALLSKTGSGKTTVIFNLIKKFRDKHTIFLLFGSTLQIDPTWKKIIEWIDDQGNEYIAEPHFLEGKEDYIKDWMHEYSHAYDDQYESEEEQKKEMARTEVEKIKVQLDPHAPCLAIFAGREVPKACKESKEIKKEKKKMEEHQKKLNFIIVLDDLSKDLRHDTIETLLKKSRHYHARVILSSQTLKDLKPSAHSQIYALCLFKGLPEADIEYLFDRYAMWLGIDRFKEIYQKVIDEKKYNFLTVLPFENELRKNLNEKIVLS